MRSLWGLVAGIGLVVMSIGCEASPDRQVRERPRDASNSKDSIRIVSISPDPTSPLSVGEHVVFRVEVNYTLTSSDTGIVTLVIQQGESGSEPLGNETQVIQRGSGNLVLTKSTEIPDTSAIQVFTPLAPQGRTSTSVVDTRAFRVTKG
jgi:hypothetical protein